MMLLPHTMKIYVANKPTDMRKSYNGLSSLVLSTLKMDPLTGQLFVFFNARRDMIKILFWDRSGFAIFQKRLEKGCFTLPNHDGAGSHVDIEPAQLALILDGIDLSHAKYKKRWKYEAA